MVSKYLITNRGKNDFYEKLTLLQLTVSQGIKL